MGDSCRAKFESGHKEFQDPSKRNCSEGRFWCAVTKSLPALDHLKTFLAMVGDPGEKFRTGEILRLARSHIDFESCSAYARVVTLPESIPVRYTEEDAGYVPCGPIVKQTCSLDEAPRHDFERYGKDATAFGKFSIRDGRVSFLPLFLGGILRERCGVCPLP